MRRPLGNLVARQIPRKLHLEEGTLGLEQGRSQLPRAGILRSQSDQEENENV